MEKKILFSLRRLHVYDDGTGYAKGSLDDIRREMDNICVELEQLEKIL